MLQILCLLFIRLLIYYYYFFFPSRYTMHPKDCIQFRCTSTMTLNIFIHSYIHRTQSSRTSGQLFVCYGGQQKGKAVSKQRMAHWIVDAIPLAYEAQGVPCPLRLCAHSTRGVTSSWALAHGALLADICRAAGWVTPNKFTRFYSLRVKPVSSCVLTSNG